MMKQLVMMYEMIMRVRTSATRSDSLSLTPSFLPRALAQMRQNLAKALVPVLHNISPGIRIIAIHMHVHTYQHFKVTSHYKIPLHSLDHLHHVGASLRQRILAVYTDGRQAYRDDECALEKLPYDLVCKTHT